MKLSVTLLWIALTGICAAAPKFAVVRVSDIFRDLPSTVAMQKDIQSQHDAIMKTIAAEQLRSIIGELKNLQTLLQTKKNELETEAGRKLVRDYEIKRQEAETLKRDFDEFRATEDKRINKTMVVAMRSSLDRIAAAAQKIAMERNLDAVFDTSGNTDTGLPFVLYARDAVDLSADVLSLLSKKPLDETRVTPDATENFGKPAETVDKIEK